MAETFGGEQTLAAVLARLGVSGALAAAPAGNSVASPRWLVTGDGGARWVLREFRTERSEAGIAYEVALIAHMAERGWPVAGPVTSDDGAVIAEGGRRFALFPMPGGEPGERESLAQLHIHGRLLARFHADAAAFPERAQRDGFGRAWELDVFVRPRADSFNALLADFGREYPELALGVRRERYRNLRELARLGYGEAPGVVVHGAFGGSNVLFRDGNLSGLLDFDLVRRDAAALDLAVALTTECVEEPARDAIVPALAGALIEGYAGRKGLAVEQARLVLPLVRAAHLWSATFHLLRWKAGESAQAVHSIARLVDRRFPALTARWAETQRAIETAAIQR